MFSFDRRFARLFALFLAALLPLTHAAAQSCGVVTVGKSGTGKNCSTNSLKTAIELATDPTKCYDNEVWITNDLDNNFFDHGTIEINDKVVKIIGGMVSTDGCNDLQWTGRSTISGVGGDTNSVFTIRGNSFVTLEAIDIVGGDEDNNGDGGGIDFKGRGVLSMRDVGISNNRAGYGGGMLVRGEGGELRVTLGERMIIASNTATANGGGIHASGQTVLNIVGNGVAIWSNRALGSLEEEGRGGGIYNHGPSFVEISARGGFPIFLGNVASRSGGAIALKAESSGRKVAMVLASSDPQRPLVIQQNSATESGGAIYSDGGSSDGAIGSADFCAMDVAFLDNVSRRGAAIYSAAESERNSRARGHVYLNNCGNINLTRKCSGASGTTCGEFRRNRAQEPDGTPTGGAVIELPSAEGNFIAQDVLFRDNVAGRLIDMGSDARSRFRLRNCIIANNRTTDVLIESAAEATEIRHCTITQNDIGSPQVLRITESGAEGPDTRVDITNSIIDQVGRQSLDHLGSRYQSVFQYLVVREKETLLGSQNVTVDDPQLQPVGDGYYQPGDFSVALDYAPETLPSGAADGLTGDIYPLERTYDLPMRGLAGRERDVGAIERRTLGDPRPPAIFSDGFE